ncbi:MipA/OmpV family protein [Rhizobiales bacterium]|uniref:MipA/OmpV family protein n=1 Tax=Hongsoonwoonella zoysiae TaxID=2821844 RepID=UPI001560CA40|nr:MipA/OmpV family protein [Hongsoonwoonella zoysiae]NRG17021.1 MipA/OmpV family protein [Hongsoonwoonella zoysiae]
MPRSLVTRACLAAATLATASVAQAQDGYLAPEDRPLPQKQYVLDLGGGAIVQPRYPGADDYLVYPFPIIAVGRFYLPGLGQIVDGDVVKRGFFFYPSFDFNGERKASDSSDLTGTRTVDWALELGLGAGYRYDWLRGFVELRQGINGHHGQVADFGIDVITNPLDRLEFSIGPRASWASEDYMDTYFGVTPGEAAASGGILTSYDPDAGFKTVGVAARASYAWTDNTTFHLQGGWDRFVGDAEDSPIVSRGDDDQFSIGIGVSYRFGFDIFN